MKTKDNTKSEQLAEFTETYIKDLNRLYSTDEWNTEESFNEIKDLTQDLISVINLIKICNL